MQNNSDIQHKIRIRNDVFMFFRDIDCVVDMYCGDLEITTEFWSKVAKSVIAIDKKNTTSQVPQNTVFNIGDSKEEWFLLLTKDVNVIDCDAYGLVFDHIDKIIASSSVDKLIFFTDGTPTKSKNVMTHDNIRERCDDIFDEFRLELNDAGTAYYGWGFRKCDSIKR